MIEIIIYYEVHERLQTELYLVDCRGGIVVRAHASHTEGHGSSANRCPDRMLAHGSPSSEWVPVGNTREANVGGKGTGHPSSHADGSG